jgi:hypothetical protein
METRTTVINELKPGKSWSVYWEVRGTPATRNAPYSEATFTCGQKVYKVVFKLFEQNYYQFDKKINEWNVQLNFETTQGNDKLNYQVFKVD